MSRGKKDKLYRSFNKGLITEAGFLTYPEDASTDELNTILYRGGNRSRRYGIDFEASSTGFNLPANTSRSSVTNEFFWRAPGDKSALNLVTLQIGNTILFFDASKEPLDTGVMPWTINLYNFKAPTATASQVRNTQVAFASGKGYLFVASEYIDPFTVTYNPDTNKIQVDRVYLMMRDFDGVGDGLQNDAEPTALSTYHHYNLKNQGWVVPGTKSVQTTIPDEVSGTPPSTQPPVTPPVDPDTGTGTVPGTYNPWGGIPYTGFPYQ